MSDLMWECPECDKENVFMGSVEQGHIMFLHCQKCGDRFLVSARRKEDGSVYLWAAPSNGQPCERKEGIG